MNNILVLICNVPGPGGRLIVNMRKTIGDR